MGDHEYEFEDEPKSESILEYEERLRSMGFEDHYSRIHYRTEWTKGDVKIFEYYAGKEWKIGHPFLTKEDRIDGSEDLDEVLESFKKAMEIKAREINYSLEFLRE